MTNATFAILGLLVVLAPAGASALTTSGPPGMAAGGTFHLVHEGHKGATAASGVVNTVDAAQRKVNVSHGSIKSLGWPAMTMDFPVSEDVDLSTIKAGMKVNFTLVKGANGAWMVDTLKPVAAQ
jgi:Cu(I)/Ag(I) efflux system periplasmic protein CusF